jgi:hypothetical protein
MIGETSSIDWLAEVTPTSGRTIGCRSSQGVRYLASRRCASSTDSRLAGGQEMARR